MKNQQFKSPKFGFWLIISGFFYSRPSIAKKAKTGTDALPPATQEGRETFGCLINGVAFTPKGSAFGGPMLKSYYQYLNSTTAQGYFFDVSASRKNGGDNGTKGIAFGTINLQLLEGKTYILNEILEGMRPLVMVLR